MFIIYHLYIVKILYYQKVISHLISSQNSHRCLSACLQLSGKKLLTNGSRKNGKMSLDVLHLQTKMHSETMNLVGAGLGPLEMENFFFFLSNLHSAGDWAQGSHMLGKHSTTELYFQSKDMEVIEWNHHLRSFGKLYYQNQTTLIKTQGNK